MRFVEVYFGGAIQDFLEVRFHVFKNHKNEVMFDRIHNVFELRCETIMRDSAEHSQNLYFAEQLSGLIFVLEQVLHQFDSYNLLTHFIPGFHHLPITSSSNQLQQIIVLSNMSPNGLQIDTALRLDLRRRRWRRDMRCRWHRIFLHY